MWRGAWTAEGGTGLQAGRASFNLGESRRRPGPCSSGPNGGPRPPISNRGVRALLPKPGLISGLNGKAPRPARGRPVLLLTSGGGNTSTRQSRPSDPATEGRGRHIVTSKTHLLSCHGRLCCLRNKKVNTGEKRGTHYLPLKLPSLTLLQWSFLPLHQSLAGFPPLSSQVLHPAPWAERLLSY